MDHNLAADTQAVELYLLGDMPPVERDDFEEHYFTCEVCGREIRAAARFRANARELLREPEGLQPQTESRAIWWRMPAFLPMAAALLLVSVVAVYQAGFEIPSLKRDLATRVPPVAEAVATIPLESVSRGPESGKSKVVQIPRTSSHVRLTFDMITDENPPAYECTVASGNKTIAIQKLEPPKAGALPDLDLYPQSLAPGHYEITVRPLPNAGSTASIPLKYDLDII
jgi:hypothetical protein